MRCILWRSIRLSQAAILSLIFCVVPLANAEGSDDQRYFVQAGAFSRIENANSLKEQLASGGIADVRVKSNPEGTPLYLVQIGPLGEPGAQAELVDKLAAEGIQTLSVMDVDHDATEAESLTDAPAPIVMAEASAEAQQEKAEDSVVSLLFVKEIRLKGSSVLTDVQVQEVAAGYIGRTVSAQELQEIRSELTNLYVSNGYVSSGVILPQQVIDDGVVYFEAIEGQLVSIDIEGDPGLRDNYIVGRVQKHLDGPANLDEIQDALNLLQGDDNIVRLDAKLEPGADPGDSILSLSVEEPRRLSFFISGDNYRAPSVGSERANVGFRARNLTGFGDSLLVSGSISDGTDEGGVFYNIPLTTNDDTLDIYAQTSDAEVIDEGISFLDIDNRTDTYGLRITHPFFSNLSSEFSASLGFEYKKNTSKLLGLPFSFSPGAIDGVSKTAMPQLGLSYSSRSASHVSAISGVYSRGIDALDANVFEPQTALDMLANPTGADGIFSLFQLRALYLKRLNSLGWFQALNDRAQFQLRGQVQYTDDPLMALQKASVGGRYSVRGYPENLLVRDKAATVSFELQLPFPGHVEKPSPGNVVFVTFLDAGVAEDIEDADPASTIRNTNNRRYIVGAGVGLIWAPIRGLVGEIYWGADVADNFEGDDPRDSLTRDRDLQDDGLHFSFRYEFG